MWSISIEQGQESLPQFQATHSERHSALSALARAPLPDSAINLAKRQASKESPKTKRRGGNLFWL